MDYNFDGIRLTDNQRYFLERVVKRLNEGSDYFYCECGDCKPWDNRTVSSLEHRKIIRFVEGGDMYIQPGGVYFISLGHGIAKQFRENKLKTILDES